MLGAGLLVLAAVWARPAALLAVAVFYGLYLGVLVVAEARLQHRITGPHRATVTSVVWRSGWSSPPARRHTTSGSLRTVGRPLRRRRAGSSSTARRAVSRPPAPC